MKRSCRRNSTLGPSRRYSRTSKSPALFASRTRWSRARSSFWNGGLCDRPIPCTSPLPPSGPQNCSSRQTKGSARRHGVMGFKSRSCLPASNAGAMPLRQFRSGYAAAPGRQNIIAQRMSANTLTGRTDPSPGSLRSPPSPRGRGRKNVKNPAWRLPGSARQFGTTTVRLRAERCPPSESRTTWRTM